MYNCALRNKLLVVALVIISSVTETKPPEFELSDQSLNLWAADSDLETWQANDAVLLDRSSAVDIGYPKFSERFC
jgi:hypothetical protein